MNSSELTWLNERKSKKTWVYYSNNYRVTEPLVGCSYEKDQHDIRMLSEAFSKERDKLMPFYKAPGKTSSGIPCIIVAIHVQERQI